MEDLPPGFRFFPTEEELISFYLHNELDGRNVRLNRAMHRVVPVLDIYEFNPWDLRQFSGDLCHGDTGDWFFFVPRQESEARGGRPKRLTTCGYWKATGSPGHVYSSDGRKIGWKRTMVFYKGRAPDGRRTEWKMNEYKSAIELAGEACSSNCAHPAPALREEFSLCRVYKKSKCIRAYDRRPVGVEISGLRRMRSDETKSATRDHHEGPDPAVVRTISAETESSSYKHQYPTVTGERGCMAMDTTTDPLWEQLSLDLDFDGEDMRLNW